MIDGSRPQYLPRTDSCHGAAPLCAVVGIRALEAERAQYPGAIRAAVHAVRFLDADHAISRCYPVGGQQAARQVDTPVMSRSRDRVTAQGTTRSLPRPSQSELSAIGMLAVSPVEEDFFRAGDELDAVEPHDFSDLDEGHAPNTLWRTFVGWLRGGRAAYTD